MCGHVVNFFQHCMCDHQCDIACEVAYNVVKSRKNSILWHCVRQISICKQKPTTNITYNHMVQYSFCDIAYNITWKIALCVHTLNDLLKNYNEPFLGNKDEEATTLNTHFPMMTYDLHVTNSQDSRDRKRTLPITK